MNTASICRECGRVEADKPPGRADDWERKEGFCYARVMGRSRRAERNCLSHTIRTLRQQLANAESELQLALKHRGDASLELPA